MNRDAISRFGTGMSLLCVLTWILCCADLVLPQEARLTPGEVVQLWLRLYPDHLDQAVELTTLDFRQGVPKKDWIETQEPLLRGMRMCYSHGAVQFEEIRGQDARVIVRTRISTVFGVQVQDEQYYLEQDPEGMWLIDCIEEYVETVN